MRRGVSEGGIWRGRRWMGGHSTGGEGLILGALDLQREVEFWEWDCISQAPGLLEVLGTGARISI
jgi:hypothetical protein